MKADPGIALTVDTENRNQGLGVDGYDVSLEEDVDWILDQFDAVSVKATFFVVGELAYTHKEMVRRIAAAGHEIGLHGVTHDFLGNTRPDEFENGVKRALSVLHKLADGPIFGFRAPFFSLTRETQWCLEILARCGFRYDASVYPGPNDRYGWPGAPRVPVVHAPTGLRLFPVPMLHPSVPIGFSGGAYLRLLPQRLIDWAFRRQFESGKPGMIYMHPWEISPSMPWRHDASVRANITRHLGRGRMRPRIQRLVRDHRTRLVPMHEILLDREWPSWSGNDVPTSPNGRSD
jgi:polysaccharide deacetylase family protein (PEP-CTERM system associated)